MQIARELATSVTTRLTSSTSHVPPSQIRMPPRNPEPPGPPTFNMRQSHGGRSHISTTISRTFFGIKGHEFRNIYIRRRFENADNVINQVKTLADIIGFEVEGRGILYLDTMESQQPCASPECRVTVLHSPLTAPRCTRHQGG